jgi:hypothetical protein
MAWKKGQSGNPAGGPRDKAFADALRLAVNEEHEPNKRKLRVIAEKLVEEAIKGESWAIQQVADRIDGKPAQESTLTIDDKRDATDWTRAELVAFLNDAKAGSNGAAKANGSHREPDSVH